MIHNTPGWYVVSDTGISGEGRRYIVSVQFMVIHVGCSDCCIQCYRKEINQQMVPQIVLIFTRRIEHYHLPPVPTSNGWTGKRFAFHAPWKLTKKLLGHSSKNTCSADWSHHPEIYVNWTITIFSLWDSIHFSIPL